MGGIHERKSAVDRKRKIERECATGSWGPPGLRPGSREVSPNVSCPALSFFQRKTVLITALGVIQLTCFPCVSCSLSSPSPPLLPPHPSDVDGRWGQGMDTKCSLWPSQHHISWEQCHGQQWDKELGYTHPSDADFWLHKRMEENKGEFFAMSNLHLTSRHSTSFLTLSMSLFIITYILAYLLPFRSLQKEKQVPGITHSRGHTLRQPGGVLFSFHCNSGAFCCGPGNVLVSKCVHAYVWCLVVRQFDQSADAKDDAKVWRAKWPLHSQTHTATANLETSWKIISSVCTLRPADLLETRGEDRKGGTERLKLASRLKHYKTTNTPPRGWFKNRSVCSFRDMCYLIANYSVRKLPHSHTNPVKRTPTCWKTRPREKQTKGAGERRVNGLNSIREPLPHSSLSLSSHQTHYQHCRSENEDGRPSAALELEQTNKNEMKVKFLKQDLTA